MVKRHRVIIVDDEPLAREELASILNAQHLDFAVVGTADNTASAWDLIQCQGPIDGLFLDIDIQSENQRAGLDFALKLNRLATKPWLIFVTGYREYAVEAFQSLSGQLLAETD